MTLAGASIQELKSPHLFDYPPQCLFFFPSDRNELLSLQGQGEVAERGRMCELEQRSPSHRHPAHLPAPPSMSQFPSGHPIFHRRRGKENDVCEGANCSCLSKSSTARRKVGEHFQLGKFSLPSCFGELGQGDLWPHSPANASHRAGLFFKAECLGRG